MAKKNNLETMTSEEATLMLDGAKTPQQKLMDTARAALFGAVVFWVMFFLNSLIVFLLWDNIIAAKFPLLKFSYLQVLGLYIMLSMVFGGGFAAKQELKLGDLFKKR